MMTTSTREPGAFDEPDRRWQAPRRSGSVNLAEYFGLHLEKDTALIYTLFATEAEKRRLRNEADRLEGATVVAWHKASHNENGTYSP